jgi:hypothetical protein
VNGAKTLVLDPSLAGPLGLVTEVSLLKVRIVSTFQNRIAWTDIWTAQQHGVDKMFWLEAGTLNATTTNVVYLCRPQIKWMKIVAGTLQSLYLRQSIADLNIVILQRANQRACGWPNPA